MTNLSSQTLDSLDGGLAVSWLPPLYFTDVERELITGYSVRWCTHTTNSTRSFSNDCKSEDVSRDSLSFQITGVEAGATYNAHIENDKWSSTLVSIRSFSIFAYTVLVNILFVCLFICY